MDTKKEILKDYLDLTLDYINFNLIDINIDKNNGINLKVKYNEKIFSIIIFNDINKICIKKDYCNSTIEDGLMDIVNEIKETLVNKKLDNENYFNELFQLLKNQ